MKKADIISEEIYDELHSALTKIDAALRKEKRDIKPYNKIQQDVEDYK